MHLCYPENFWGNFMNFLPDLQSDILLIHFSAGIYYMYFPIWNGEEAIWIYLPIKCTDRGKYAE